MKIVKSKKPLDEYFTYADLNRIRIAIKQRCTELHEKRVVGMPLSTELKELEALLDKVKAHMAALGEASKNKKQGEASEEEEG